MVSRLTETYLGARYGKTLMGLLRTQTERVDMLVEENERLRTINLDLGRYCLSLLEGMIVEMNDPGTLPEDPILHAASDMADQIARMEEHTV